jgi:hypothetical protein
VIPAVGGGGAAGGGGPPPPRAWLLGQAVLALAVNHLLLTVW